MKNGYHQPPCPIIVKDNNFPTNRDKAEEFSNHFASVSSTEFLPKNEQEKREFYEKSDQFNDPLPDNSLSINSDISLQEMLDALHDLGKKKSAVGLDGLSYSLLKNLPDSWLSIFHKLLQRCWLEGEIPSVWKSSIVIPILKPGKPRIDKTSYRPISLTSHVSKVLEKIILNRLTYYCEKNDIIPPEQAGFRKGRSTTDHLVKITTNIKKQFAHKKSTIATFFDVSKAYDSVWHKRLLLKLKQIGLSGNIFQFVKSFLSNRNLFAKVGNSYSSSKYINMGIPQGSILSPLLFNILLHDLPNALSKNSNLAQFADDISIWMNVSIRKKTSIRIIKYYQKLYQKDINSLAKYMEENGLTFSSEKTNLMLFLNGQKPKALPKLYLNEKELRYATEVKFLGVYLTPKLNWKKHIEYVIHKAVKNYNLLKYIRSQPWGQDSTTLKHLAISLVRSILSYGQEVYFNAPKTYLNKIRSLDSKAIKLALGVPVHTNTLNAYKFANVLPIEDYRKLCCSKYIVRLNNIFKNVPDDILIRSDVDFPRRSRQVKSFQTIATYTQNEFTDNNLSPQNVTKLLTHTPSPSWELQRANFDIDYTNLPKNDFLHLVGCLAREKINNDYQSQLQIYSDGSVSEERNAGCGFTIPFLGKSSSFFLGKGFSIYTAELIAILMALEFIIEYGKTFNAILFCVDSKAALQAIKSHRLTDRGEIVFQIKHLVHQLIIRGSIVNFLWVPSHTGLLYNDWADRAAKRGSKNIDSVTLNLSLSKNEIYTILKSSKTFQHNNPNQIHCKLTSDTSNSIP